MGRWYAIASRWETLRGPRGQEAVVVGELCRLRDRDPAEDLLNLQGVHPLQRIGLRAEGTVGKSIQTPFV